MSQKIAVSGMTCNNCVRHVTQALLEIEGVAAADVDLASGNVTVRASRLVGRDEFARALEEAGYTLT